MWNINAPQGCIPCAIFITFAEDALQDALAAWAPARGGQGGQPPTLEKIRVGMAHPGNINRGLKTFRQ